MELSEAKQNMRHIYDILFKRDYDEKYCIVMQNVNWKLVLKFLGGWILTVIFSCGIAYVIFSASVHSPGYVVP
jgi:phosphate/sulfate permease